MNILFVNSGLKGIPQGYSRSIVGSLREDFRYSVNEIWPQQLSLELINKYRPDLLFVFHGNLTPLSLVRNAGSSGIVTLCWIVEDPYELDVHSDEWLDSFDFIFTNEREVLKYYQREHVYYLPWCTNPAVYQPQTVSTHYRSDLCFVGMGFQNRVELINQLIDYLPQLEIKLIGNWEKWGASLKPCLQERVLPVISRPEEIARYYAGAKINLNVHRDPLDEINVNSPGITATSLNNRTFDIAACRGFQLIDNSRGELSDFYLPDREIITFANPYDLAGKIRYYLSNNHLRQQIASRSYFKTTKLHTFKNRLRRIFSIIGGN